MPAKILVVDDEESVRQLFQIVLQHEGYEVVLATNGAEALIAAHNEQPDLIILDWMMPMLDGLAVLQQLRKDDVTAHIPIIMLTAKQSDTDTHTALVSGADVYLTKPFEPQDVLSIIARLLPPEKAPASPA
jgi:two-component system alkaline phosphatase synthesis response regulator PhoP/two-component system response regulator VicR